jgi:signal transduction histidine kinase
MRLKTRILLFASIMIAAAVLLCCTLILKLVRSQMEQDAAEKATAAFDEVYSDVIRLGSGIDDPAYADTYMAYKVRKADKTGTYTLSCNGNYLINNVGFSPEPYLIPGEESIDPMQSFCRVFGTLYHVTGKTVYCFDRSYVLTKVTDLSGLDDYLKSLAWRCVGIGAAVTAAFLLLAYFILSASLRPIKTLQSGAQAITSGDYHTRIKVKRRDEIGLLSADFNAMANAVESSIAELKEQNARKQQFINDLSHEMKTPVTSLLLNSETLVTRTVTEEDRQRALVRIHEQAKWIERLSQKLMQLVLLQDEIELVPSPVRPLLDAVSETVQDSLARSQITLTAASDEQTIPMDFDLLRSALVNLIENAIKASEPGSTVELITEDHAIVVRDHGRGIPKDEIARITEPFYMVDRSRSKRLGGSGLGLALVQRIVEAHHAVLSIESEVGRGSSFFIRFSDAV